MKEIFTEVIELLYLAKQDEVEIVLNNGRLQLKVAEDKDIDQSLLNRIRANKELIIDFLSKEEWKFKRLEDARKIVKVDKSQPSLRIPLSFSQERLWFIDQLEGSLQYHITAVLRLKGKLNFKALESALNAIVNRHEILRTVYVEEGGQAWQHLKPENQWKLKISSGASFLADTVAQENYIQSITRSPFDLSKDYMLRCELIMLAEEDHILAITMHHIASDAWSTPILVNEVGELYRSYDEGHTRNINPLQLQYSDYAIWQRSYLQGEVLEEKLSYWRKKLENVSPLQLPLDFDRPAINSSKGSSVVFTIPSELRDHLRNLSQQNGATLYMTLLAAFDVLLYRYSGQDDICVGTSIAGRPQTELEGLIGFFVNTLALRTNVKDKIDFIQLLQQVKETMLEAYVNQEVPFERVVEAVVKDRDASRNPLFQVMLVLRNTPDVPELKLGNISLSGVPYEHTTVKFDLTFFLTESPRGIQGSVLYSTDLFSSDRIKRMIEHFTTLLNSIVAYPIQQVGQLELLSLSEREQLVAGFNQSEVLYPRGETVVSLFERQVREKGHAVALVSGDRELTYEAFNSRSNQLAHYLRLRGVKEDDLVGLYVDRSVEMLVGMMGILKAGGAYVPIDTDFPADRISYMLADSGCRVVISSKESRSKLELAEVGVEIIEIDGQSFSDQPTGNPVTGLQPHHLAYVIYTSGSTGNPKGVMIEHRHLLDYVFGLDQQTQIGESRNYALVSTIATDLGNTVIYSSLLLGGALHIFTKEQVSNIEYLHDYFAENGIDCVKIVPSHWKALKLEGELLLPRKLLVFGGEALPSEVVEDIRHSGSLCKVVNHYGPTETTIGKLLHVTGWGQSYNSTIPIGKPFSNTRVYVLSKELQLTPVGVAGQLYIAGQGVARGYLNNEELTAQKFISNPYNNGEGYEVMYATGDLVKYQPDGNIQFIGRVDDQVKIRGYRVELGEIESLLQQSSLVSQAVVLAREDKQGNKRLIGYVVPSGGSLEREELMLYLKEKLPEYMIPSVVVELESLPLTANGKVNRKALPDPEVSELLSGQYVAPRNAIEARLAEIWQDVLEEEQIGMNDDFFELGGHSLLAVRLVSAIRKGFSVEIPISHVFDYPTIARLAQQLEQPSDTVVLPSIEVIRPRPSHIPLSFSQERLWFIHRMEGSIQYHVPVVLKLQGKLDKEALSHAMQQVVERHEVLRTVFREQDGEAYQVIQENTRPVLQVVDGSNYAQDTTGLEQYIKQLIRTPFDLSEDTMLRSHLVVLGKDDYLLVVTLHHIASDGWSRSILVKELADLYAAASEGRASALKPLTVQYADFALWQRSYLQGEVLDKKLDYWKEKLTGVLPLDLPTDYGRPAVQGTRGAVTGFRIDKELADALQQLSHQQGATLYMTLLSAFNVLLSRYSDQQDICIGTPIAGRQQQELEGLIGFFVNTLAMRSQVDSEASFTSLLEQVKATTMEGYANQEIPFEKVVEVVAKDRDMSRNPLFQVMFILRNTPDVPELRFGDVALSRVPYQHNTSLFDFSLFITETADGLHALIEYSTDLYTRETMQRMGSHFTRLLSSIAATPQEKVGRLEWLTAEERETVTTGFNATTTPYPLDKSLVDLFEEQVQRLPLAVSVVFEGEELSYKELDERSNCLAHYLSSKGVKEGMLVPICVERSVNMIVGVLGILKSGAAYVPVDPQYPSDRISYMLADSKASLIVTSGSSRARVGEPAGVEQVELDTQWPLISTQPSSRVSTTSDPHSLAYVIYTSGSTGKPKGVRMGSSGMVNLLSWQEKQFSCKNRRVLQFASLTFDVSFQEIFSTLCFGSSLYLISEDRRKDMSALLDDIAKHGLTHLFVPYIVLKSLVEYIHTLSGDIILPQEIMVAGEQLKLTEDIRELIEKKGIKLVNQYGPTEAHVVSSYTIDPQSSPALPPIGKPVDNTCLYVVDRKAGGLCPIGVPGELYIGGVQVAQGYLHREELTAEKFIQDRFNKTEAGWLYRTGDLARWLPDGNLEYLGRIDEQVKVRGYRIELGEIESVLQQSGLVSKGVVVARQDSHGHQQLVGYVETSEKKFDKEAVISYLQSQLPQYTVPLIWVELERLPVTPNGKVDKRALPEPDVNELSTKQYVAPRTETEQKLAEIWQQLLGVQKVGINDNFFELGGHSLMVMRVVAYIRKELAAEIAIKDIFNSPTISQLSEKIQADIHTPLLPTIEAINPKPEFIPLSFSQERLWFLDQLEGSVQYHLPTVLTLKGALNQKALSYALRTIVNRHEVLRTVFLEKEGHVYQKIKDRDQWTLNTKVGFHLKEDNLALKEHVQQLISRPFRLSQDDMLRAELIILDDFEHILVVTLHHIASDGWSRSILVKELVELYEACEKGIESSLTPLDIQYADFAIWQRNYLKDDVLESKLSYWKEKLEGIEVLQMPTDYPRPPVQSTRGAVVNFSIEKDVSISLQKLSVVHGSTLFMTLLSAFNVLLYRYSRQKDICIGIPTAGRQQQELEGLIGFFINTLALRNKIEEEVSFIDLLQQVTASTLEAYEHQDVPFEKVVEAVMKDRDMARSPLFQVMFILQNAPEVPKLRLGDLQLFASATTHNTSKYDLTFLLAENSDGLLGSVEYCVDLFDEQTIKRLIGNFKHLLSSVITSPNTNISVLPILTDGERHELLEEFNNTRSDYFTEKTVVALLEEQVLKTPQSVALIFEGEELTYNELNRRSNQVAHYLREHGVTEETLVPICIERSIEMIVGMIGILKAGGAYVPIDPNYPEDRIKFMIEDVAASLVITSRAIKAKLPIKQEVEVLEIDEESLINIQADYNLQAIIHPGNIAYVVYTSGSTGIPKGVVIEHRSLTNLINWHTKEYEVNAASRSTSTAGVGFDAFGWEIWPYLSTGSSIYIIDNNQRLHTSGLVDFFIRNKITHSFLSTALVRDFINASGNEIQSLKYLLTGGDKLSSIDIEGRNYNLINNYGPTEYTIVTTNYKVRQIDKKRIPPIGSPIANTTIYIVDTHNELVPVNVIGEICVGGAGLSRGYLNRPEFTSEKFIENPFKSDGSRIYKTGDFGRWLADGTIEYVGRIDEQVKVRGYRIELGEIETLLEQSGMVGNAIISTRKDGQGNNHLVGYVVPSEFGFDKQSLISFLQGKLPEYMVPSIWVELEELPLTANGKIDRKALPEPDINGDLHKEFLAPRSETEAKMAKIWQELLGVQRVGVHDNFFELGGHSLLVFRVVSAIRKEFEVEIPIRDIFNFPTIARLVERFKTGKDIEVLPPIEVVQPRPEFIPLSFSQERLWFIDRFEGSVQYHVPTALRLKGKLNKEALQAALQTIVNRHEVLRTVFLEAEGQVFQHIKDKDQWHLNLHDAARFKENSKELGEYVQTLINKPFDLSKDHMIRAELISLKSNEHVLVVTFHHIASDAWSMPIFIEETVRLYRAYDKGDPDSLDSLPIQYADFAIWQRNYLKEDVLDKKIKYWKDKLEGLEPLQLPTDFTRPPVSSSKGAVISSVVDKELLQHLHELSQQQGATLFMTLLSVFQVLLYKYSGQLDICVGTPIAGRQQQELEGLIGFFVNTLALRIKLNEDASFIGLLQQVRAETLQAYENQDVPFEKVVDTVAKHRDISRSPLFQVMFILQNAPKIPNMGLGELELSAEGAKNNTSKFDITFFATERIESLLLSVEYSLDLYNEQTIQRLLKHFIELLRSVTRLPEQKVSALPMLALEEKQQLLIGFNNTEVVFSDEKSVVNLFEEQVKKMPMVTSVVFEGEELSYQELDERSNQLANYLRCKGAKEGMLVPISIERSLNMIVGVLAILKSGAAYVPVDPEYPSDRISYMLSDSGAGMILTSSKSRIRLPNLSGLEIVELDSNWGDISRQPATKPLTQLRPDHLVYVIYTSGSTGRPKGVKMGGRGMLNLLSWQQKQFTNKHRRVLQFASLTFDVSFQEIFSTLCFGSTLYLINEDRRKDMSAILQDIKVHQITHLFVPHIVLKSLVEFVNALLEDVVMPQQVIVAGEQLQLTEDIRKLIDQKKVTLINQYGPTEAHVVSSYTIDPQSSPALPPIGKPIDNTELYVVNQKGDLCPIGVPGELYIGGVQVAHGYLNRAELTAEKFVEDYFSNKDGGRLYRTGDLVKWLADGNLEYLGRIDDQVKVRGYRIELGEIESVLQQSQFVSQGVIVAREDGGGYKRLVGYVVPSEKKLDKQGLNAYLQTQLPEYMVPALWVELESMPLTPNGKIDKRALPDVDQGELLSKEFVAPRTEAEQKLANVWQQLLGVPKVGVHDNFFELGGHSLLAVRVVSAMNKALQVELTIKDLFLNPSVAELVEHIEGDKSNVATNTYNLKSLVEIKKGGNKLPLYIVSGGGGTIFKFKEFSEMLDANQPVYGLQQPTNVDELDQFPDTVEGIATAYVEEILLQNPTGPYAISGHCVGGVIAFEMAKQLEALGKKVEVLAMFDTILNQPAKRDKKSFKNLYHIPLVIKKSLSQLYWKARFETHLLKNHTRYALRYKIKKLRLISGKRKDLADQQIDVFRKLERNFLEATKKYKITEYNGDVIVFYAKEHYYFLDIQSNVSFRSFSLKESTRNIWQPYVRSVKMYEIEGEHSTIFFSKNATQFAALLQQELDKHN